MKTLYVNAVSCKAGGGLNDLVNSLPLIEETLAREDWRVATWVVPAGFEALHQARCRPRDVSVVRVESPWSRAVWELLTFPRLVRRGQPDVVYHFSNFVFRELPVPQMTVLRSPTYFSADYANRRRTGLYQSLRYHLGRRLSAATVRRANRVFCISEVHRQDIIATLGEVGHRVDVSHLGVAAPAETRAWRLAGRRPLFDLMPRTLARQLAPLATADRRVVLNVSHYYEHKNLGDLLEAASSLSEEISGFALILTAGLCEYRGPWNRRTRRDVALANRLRQRGLLFDVGPVPKPWVWKLMALAEVFAFPSSLESFGHPLLEAMSVGLPVVAADTPIHREICGPAAVYHPIGAPASLARQLGELLQADADQTRQTSPHHETNRRIAAGVHRAAGFSWERHAEQTCQAVLQLAGVQHRGRVAPPAPKHTQTAGAPNVETLHHH